MYSIIDIAEGRFGKKVVAANPIRKNLAILRMTGVPLSFEETTKLGEKESFGLQVSTDCYMYLDAPGRYINHSCDPNCGITPALDLIAIRNIMAGEELTYDYSTTMLERHWTMDCKCGSSRCRKVVRDFDQLPPAIQDYYLGLNVVQRYIVTETSKKDERSEGPRPG
jgi:uncharacterized protein